MNLRITALSAGFLLAIPCLAQVGGFGGPSVLTRGTRPQGREGARPVSFTGSVSLNGVYASGLTAAATDGEGNLLDDTSAGGSVGWGLSGNRQGRRDNFTAAYGGTYAAFTKATYYSGLNQSLNLTYNRQLSRRWNAFLAQSGVSGTNAFDTVRLPGTDEFSAHLPDSQFEIVDNPYVLLSSAAGLNYQKSARLSFSMSGGAVFQRRRSDVLSSSDGFIGTGSMSYMLSRRQQIGVSYSYGTYSLTKAFGETQVQTPQFFYGRVLSRRWFFNGSAGVYQADSRRLERVAVDPFIVLLTGQTETLQVFDGRRFGFSSQAAISGRFRHATVNIGYERGISPGNGVYFIAETERASAGIGLEGRRRWSLSANADWNRMKAVTQQLGNSTGYGGSLTTSYRLTRLIHATATAQFTRWDIDASQFGRNRYYASVGLTFSPGELPLALW